MGDALHSFSQHSPRYAGMGCGGWEGNFLITASSKDKTFCHLLYSLQKQKPPVKIIKTCCQNIKTIKTNCQNHQKHQNLLSKHQNHQNLLSKHQNHQNHLSKSSKPTVNNIKTIKTTCQNIKTYCHDNMIDYTGSPALYRKSRPYTGSPAPQSIILTGGVVYLLLKSLKTS